MKNLFMEKRSCFCVSENFSGSIQSLSSLSCDNLSELPLKAGWVQKKGRKLGFWHKRYCVLTGSHLYLMKSKKSKHPKTVLRVGSETLIEGSGKKLILSPRGIKTTPTILQIKDGADLWKNTILDLSLHDEQLSMNSFEILSVIGRGHFGKVMLCRRNNSNMLFAIKSVHKSLYNSQTILSVFNERNILHEISHPFIVSLHFVFQSSTKVYFGLDYTCGGDLAYHLDQYQRISIERVKLYIAEISIAIHYLHSLQIVYRDLKPENILINDNGHIKIADFGLATKLLQNQTLNEICGTLNYMAPEMINYQPYSYGIDWWALGITAYYLYFGVLPFKGANRVSTCHSISSKQPFFPQNTPPSFQSLINGLLEKDPNQRLNYQSIRSHPFFEDMDFDQVERLLIVPPYIPDNSLSNFDRDFTSELKDDSECTEPTTDQDAFRGLDF